MAGACIIFSSLPLHPLPPPDTPSPASVAVALDGSLDSGAIPGAGGAAPPNLLMYDEASVSVNAVTHAGSVSRKCATTITSKINKKTNTPEQHTRKSVP